MKCNRCKKEEADLLVNDVVFCYDCALTVEGDDAVAAAKFHAELYAAREENRQLRARVAELETEREKRKKHGDACGEIYGLRNEVKTARARETIERDAHVEACERVGDLEAERERLCEELLLTRKALGQVVKEH